MAYSLELDFFTDIQKTMRITVHDANPSVTEAAVKTAMETICAKGAAELIQTSAGSPISIKAASLTERNETVYDLT
jgi:hypothetical protein